MAPNPDKPQVRDGVEFDPGQHQHLITQVLEEKKENSEWDADEMEEALRDVGSGLTYGRASKDAESFSKKTLSRVWSAVMDELIEEVGVPQSGDGEPVFTDPARLAADEFETFFEELTEDFDISLPDRVVKMMVSEIRDSGELPQPQYLVTFVKSANGTTSNQTELNFISRRYQQWLQKFYRENPIAQGQVGTGNPLAGGMSGPQQGPMGGTGGGFPTNGGQQQPVGGQPQMGGGQGQQMQMMQMFQQMMEQQREQTERMIEKLTDGDGDDGKDQLDELIEYQEKIEKLTGGSDQKDQMLSALHQEIQQVKQQMGSPGGGGGNPMQQVALQMAQRDDIDANELSSLMDMMGVDADPTVAEARIEKEKREMELEHSAEKWESLADTGMGMVQTLVRELQQAQAQQQQQQQQQAQPQQQAAQAQMGATPQQQTWQGTATQTQQAQQSDTGMNATEKNHVADPPAEPAEADGGTVASPPSDGESEPAGSKFPDEEMDWTCPKCDAEQQINPAEENGRWCDECGYGVSACPGCESPIHVEPREDAEWLTCPDCESPIPNVDSEQECPMCSWQGVPADDADGVYVECDECGLEMSPDHSDAEGE